ncbi:MAG: hypothetical protein QOF30_1067 [Acidimicrobiaceae bacterium]|jgi:hypothetical protein|nr:hypothetical protein [Acidimicrobiaceae bacterium]
MAVNRALGPLPAVPPGADPANGAPPANTPPQAIAAAAPAAAAPAVGGGAGSPDDSPPTGGPFVEYLSWGFVVVYLAAAAVLIIMALVADNRDSTLGGLPVGRWWSLVFGIGVVGIALLILQAVGASSKFGIFRPLVGHDKRFSTSLTQIGIWTVAAGTGFGYLLGRVMFDGVALGDVLPGKTWDQYLILLGGPFAAAVLAKGIVTYKLTAGTLQKSESSAPVAAQVVTNDSGSADLIDSQYLIFNIIALGYFVVQLAGKSVLPEIPSPLLAMTSATAGVYVANKAAQKNAPTITSVSPQTAAPSAIVTVLGTNFDPGENSDATRRVSVTLSGVPRTLYSTDTTDTRIRFAVPGDAPVGPQTVIVTSTAGVETEAHDLQIIAPAPAAPPAAPPVALPAAPAAAVAPAPAADPPAADPPAADPPVAGR